MKDDDQGESSDIYRGPPHSSYVVSQAPLPSISDSSSSRSLRLGSIATVLERAISRWARRRHGASDAASSSSSSSSSSFRSSLFTSRSRRTRIRRYRSTTTIYSLQSDRNLAAHVSRLRAREESRQVPQQFTLYLPPALSSYSPTLSHDAKDRRIISSTLLSHLLPQFDSALRKAARVRRNQPCQLIPVERHPERHNVDTNSAAPPRPKAWYMDVASPTWEDMRTLGKMLRLHPLTLEDILQRDSREKLELFPKLGYYFLSFRAIELLTYSDTATAETVENSGVFGGSVREANVYLVVFNEGICTFHFTDISEHTERIRNRIMMLEGVFNMSSDWIAHGILDSIVDSFFPLLEEIEKEVVAIEDIVLTTSGSTSYPRVPSPARQVTHKPAQRKSRDLGTTELMTVNSDENEKFTATSRSEVLNVTSRRSTPSLVQRVKRFVSTGLEPLRSRKGRASTSSTYRTLMRMARTRKLVTTLARLLATKSEVVSQIRKRLLTSTRNTRGSGSRDDDLEIAIHLGDVQDHILTLQHSLAHYERILSQSHPTYLSQLRAGVAITQTGTDKVIILASISIAVLCLSPTIGVLSTNVTIPHNTSDPSGSYHVFGIVIALTFLTLSCYGFMVRRWWNQAKAKHQKRQVL